MIEIHISTVQSTSYTMFYVTVTPYEGEEIDTQQFFTAKEATTYAMICFKKFGEEKCIVTGWGNITPDLIGWDDITRVGKPK